MTFLRTASTRRLLGVIAGIVAAIAATAAIAVAASGSGPAPKAQPLAAAIHQALGAKTVHGVTADITFTNHLIDASALQGSDPILSGATGRLWLSDRHELRLELQSANGDAEVLVAKGRFWISDPASHTVYEGTVPKGLMGSRSSSDKTHGIPSVAEISKTLAKVMQHVNLSGASPGNQAGQPAYTVTVSPKHDGGLLGSLQLAWDAARGVPLRFAIYARGNPSPVIELRADDISYGAVPASDFNIAPPAGSQIVKVATGSAAAPGSVSPGAGERRGAKGHHTEIRGVKQVAAKLPFTLTAPKTLVGLPRHTVTLLDWGGHRAALVTYGQGLGGIAVIEKADTSGTRAAGGASSSSSGTQSGSGPGGNVSLPTVSINGATGHELDTALGTLVTFSRGGVSYTVIGSVPSAAADAAARGL